MSKSSVWLVCRMSPTWGLFSIFSWFCWSHASLGRISLHQISGHTMSTYMYYDVNPNHLAKMMSARMLHCKCTIFPFVITTYLEGGTLNLCYILFGLQLLCQANQGLVFCVHKTELLKSLKLLPSPKQRFSTGSVYELTSQIFFVVVFSTLALQELLFTVLQTQLIHLKECLLYPAILCVLQWKTFFQINYANILLKMNFASTHIQWHQHTFIFFSSL